MASKKSTVKTLTIFNSKLTVSEAKQLIKHKGPIMYPNTEHNRKAIASAIGHTLNKIRKV